jgi:phosphate:Na+ symporter
MNVIFSLFAVYIMIFLFGMVVMRIGLDSLSKDKIQKLLVSMTNTPWRGLLVGTICTAIIQSSSAVMVITVGLVSAGILSFQQSVGIILGTNIGTTVTAEIITLDLDHLIIPFLLIGAAFLFTKKRSIFCIGCILFGLGCMFVSMNGFEGLALPMAAFSVIKEYILHTNDSMLMGILGGTVMTAVIQSSSAMTGVVMGFMTQKLLTLPAGIAIILGANIGTCITAYIASFKTNIEAKLVAYTHIWLNLLGVLLFYPLIHYLSSIVAMVTPIPDQQLAHASVLFNILTSLLFLFLIRPFTNFVQKVHRIKV